MSVSSSTSTQSCSLHLHVESKPQSKTAIRKEDQTESQHQADLHFHFLLRACGVFQVLRMQGLCDLSNLQASARAAPVAPSPPAVPSPQRADKHPQIIHSTHYNTDALPGPCRTRAFFSGGALISTMRLMAHYRPIHKYCLQYYHFQGPLSSFTPCYCFPPSFCFSYPTLRSFIPLTVWATSLATRGRRRRVFVPFRVETGPEEHQVTAATQRGEMQSCSIEQSYKWWQSALWLCSFVALGFSPLRPYAGGLMRPWPIFTSTPAPRSVACQALYNFYTRTPHSAGTRSAL